MDSADIGCSLAEAAETPTYHQYLAQAADTGKPAMHVVYINTSLKTKAQAHAVVPTITCTSSNVVQTVLQVSTTTSCAAESMSRQWLLLLMLLGHASLACAGTHQLTPCAVMGQHKLHWKYCAATNIIIVITLSSS